MIGDRKIRREFFRKDYESAENFKSIQLEYLSRCGAGSYSVRPGRDIRSRIASRGDLS